MSKPAKQRKDEIIPKKQALGPTIGGGMNGYFPEGDDEETQGAIIRNAMIEATRYFNAPVVKTLEEANERIIEYFNHCIDDKQRPTVEGLALCLGTTRQTLYNWEHGIKDNKYIGPDMVDVVKKSKEIIANYDANLVARGKLNPVTYIFRAKNYYGMRDTQDYILTPNAKEEISRDRLIEEAEQLPDD